MWYPGIFHIDQCIYRERANKPFGCGTVSV
jgi:hypothetical protein